MPAVPAAMRPSRRVCAALRLRRELRGGWAFMAFKSNLLGRLARLAPGRSNDRDESGRVGFDGVHATGSSVRRP